MGRVLIRFAEQVFRLPLNSSTLIGRGDRCDGVLLSSGVPLYWVEFRWRQQSWWWRALAATERTRGPGSLDSEGWRPITQRRGRGQSISLEGLGKVELVDDSPPGLIVEDVVTRERLEEPEATELLGPEGAVAGQQLVERYGRLWRVHRPGKLPDTATTGMDLQESFLDIYRDNLRATFTFGSREVVLEGESVRVLMVFAEVRMAGGPEGGWLTAVDAYDAWVSSGGNPKSGVDRLAWERGKLRTELRKRGLVAVEALFEKRGSGAAACVRLGLPTSRVEVWASSA